MAWTAPTTWVANAVLTAAQLNTQLRDNMLELAPALAQNEGGLFFVDGTNSIQERLPQTDRIATSQTTTSTAFVDLATVGPSVTLTTGTRAMVFIGCQLENNGANQASLMSYAVSGASTISAGNDTAIVHSNPTASNFVHLYDVDSPALTAGTNTFTAKYRVGAGTGTFEHRFIAVLPM